MLIWFCYSLFFCTYSPAEISTRKAHKMRTENKFLLVAVKQEHSLKTAQRTLSLGENFNLV